MPCHRLDSLLKCGYGAGVGCRPLNVTRHRPAASHLFNNIRGHYPNSLVLFLQRYDLADAIYININVHHPTMTVLPSPLHAAPNRRSSCKRTLSKVLFGSFNLTQ